MGEIKSTLDIIMEKAKGFTVTEEEKKAFREKEIEGEVHGVFQKYLDGFMAIEKLKEEIQRFGESRQRMVIEALKKACMDRINQRSDNAPLLEVLDRLLGIDIQPIVKILAEMNGELENQRKSHEGVILRKLRDKGISGSAVIPNMKADKEWNQYLSEMTDRFRQRLQAIT